MVDVLTFFEILLAAFTAGLVITGIFQIFSSDAIERSSRSLKESTDNLIEATNRLGRLQIRPLLGMAAILSDLVENPRPHFSTDRPIKRTRYHFQFKNFGLGPATIMSISGTFQIQKNKVPEFTIRLEGYRIVYPQETIDYCMEEGEIGDTLNLEVDYADLEGFQYHLERAIVLN
jgi:hypothetical protein